MKSKCCKVNIKNFTGGGKSKDFYIEPTENLQVVEPKYDWGKELELNFYPFISGGQGFTLKRFIQGLLKRQKKEIFSRLPGKDDPMSREEIIEKIEDIKNEL